MIKGIGVDPLEQLGQTELWVDARAQVHVVRDADSFVTPHMVNVILWLRENAWLLHEEVFADTPEQDDEVDATAWINSTRLVRALLAELARRAASDGRTSDGDICG